MRMHGSLVLSADQAGIIQVRDFAQGFTPVCPDISLTTKELQENNVINFQQGTAEIKSLVVFNLGPNNAPIIFTSSM